jgi:hypothetical protein
MKKLVFALFVLSIAPLSAQVDLNYFLEAEHPYDKSIPTPYELLGYNVGEWHVSHDKLVYYMERIAAASDRIHIETRGRTYEGRPILLLTITSPENHKKIATLQKTHQQLSEPGSENIDVSSQPVVLYQGFSIHGNEPSGANAGLLLAYHLAASQAPETLSLLNDVIVLFDPSFNPDGLQRFAHWANSNKNQNLIADPVDREYNEEWPRGRTNHYWFDLNRDWLPVQLPESQARMKTFTQWLPNILTDHHEMGTNSSFFFQPGIPNRVNPLTPDLNQKLTQKIGTFHAEAFNKLGSLYYSEEDYDDFYYGKGSTYPDINGSIGILFEQASSRGHLQESDNGLLSFAFTIRNQLTAGFSTLAAAQSMRVELLEYFRDFHKDMRAKAAKDKQKAIVVGSPKDPATTYHFAETLKRHEIKVHQLKETLVRDGKTYSPESSIVIPLEQKKYQVIQAMFSKQATFKDSLFYDISAWTFPYAFNLNHSFETSLQALGEEITEVTPPKGGVDRKGSYAYVFEAHHYYTPKLLHTLQNNNVRIKVGLTPFTVEGTSMDYGTYMIPVKNQEIDEEKLYSLIQNAAEASSVPVKGVDTGLTQGIDFGSRDFTTVKKPVIALLVGDGVSSYDAGEIWHLLDTRHQIPITKLDIEQLGRADLSRYTHFILSNFSGSGLESHTEKLKTFVRNGGTLIGYRNSVRWLDRKEFIDLEFLSQSPVATDVSFRDKDNFRGAQVTGGAIFNASIDRSHPINFGFLNTTLPLFRNTNVYIKADKQSYNNPIQYTNQPLLSGYISEENLDLLKNSVPFQVQALGRGKVIVMTDNTNFRAFWYGTNRILTNALFLSDKM